MKHSLRHRGSFSFDDDDDEFDAPTRFSSSGGFSSKMDRSFAQPRQRAQIDWNSTTLKPFRKDFYTEHENVKNMSIEEIENFRKQNSMLVFNDNKKRQIPNPFRTWEESGLPDSCISHLTGMGIDNPTPIQQQGIPMALSGNDVIGISRTGSGKTLAYILPAIVHIQAQPLVEHGEGAIGLILCPTRELCIQINDEISKYMKSVSKNKIKLNHLAVYGGAQNRSRQIEALRRQPPDILVATPGRLIDLYESGETNFLRTTYVVLDEADRMLDMGFRDDLTRILSYIRPDKQVLMWSATWPKEIQQIAYTYMQKPFRVQIGSLDLHANSNIEQNFRLIRDKNTKLDHFIKDIEEICVSKKKKCLVFVNTKRDADKLEYGLSRLNGVNAKAIHGDKTQRMRENILYDFKKSYSKCLIATDVVARGIDIRDIGVVVNFDFPNSGVEQYVHRIGRTARGDDKGVSLSYLEWDDVSKHGKSIVNVLRKANQKIPKWMLS